MGFFAMLGMLSPASRGALLTAAIFLYEFMGLVAGYYSGRLYRTMKGKEWKAAAFLTATLYPGIVFGIGFFINLFIWGKHSSGAIPFTTMLSVGAMWFGISLPLVFLGYYFGYRKQPYEHPVRTNQIPRQVRCSSRGDNSSSASIGISVYSSNKSRSNGNSSTSDGREVL